MEDERKITLKDASKELKVPITSIGAVLIEDDVTIEANPEATITGEQFEFVTRILRLVKIGKDGDWYNSQTGRQLNKNDVLQVIDVVKGSMIDIPFPEVNLVAVNDDEELDDEEPKYLQLDFVIPDHITDEEARKHIEDVLLKLDETHRDFGGHGLKVKDLQVLLQAKLKEVSV